MKKLNTADLINLLEDPYSSLHSNLIFDMDEDLNLNFEGLSNQNTFKDCEFYGYSFRITSNTKTAKKGIEFYNCKIEINEISFVNCEIQNFIISKSDLKGGLELTNCDIWKCHLKNSVGKLNLRLDRTTFIELIIRNIRDAVSLDSHYVKVRSNAEFNSTTFKSFQFHNSSFKEELICIDSTILTGIFKDCNLNEFDFGLSSFNNLKFKKCEIKGTCTFEKISGDRTTLTILDCTFHKHCNFETNPIKSIVLFQTKFYDTVSFQDSVLDFIIINKVLFERSVFFEDLEINDISYSGIKTIRNIKRQLILSDNKIDYMRFKKYELELHRLKTKSLLFTGKYERSSKYRSIQALYRDRKIYDSDDIEIDHLTVVRNDEEMPKANKLELLGDYLTLSLHRFMSLYGTDWKRSIFITILFGVIFYSILYFSMKHSDEFHLSWRTVNHYLNGLPRFFIVTDFKNPIKINSYYDNSFSWLPLIFGKLLIGFGIYETIQSFRKFSK